jgi:CDP-6-deoxy-D-xylo-4-hexulose-3-dehydrase
MIPLMKNTFFREYETKAALCKFLMKVDKLSMGEKCAQFEFEFAKMHERKDAILTNSGASANLIILQTLKNLGRLKEGNKIGFSALTWSTNVMPIIQLGFTPVAVDCEKDKLNVTSASLLQRLKETELHSFFITNALGFAGDLDEIQKICKAKNIILLEDNCEALGTKLKSGMTGNFGLASSFSFFVAHHMSTIEGGMICTDDQEVAEMSKIVRANGWDRNLNAQQQQKWRKKYNITTEFEAKYAFYDLGYNLRPTEITGFLGLSQLEHLEENIKKRETLYLKLEKIVSQNDDLIPIDHKHISFLSPFAFPVLCKNTELRSQYLAQFAGAGIEVRPMIAGNIQMQPFYNKYVLQKHSLPDTDFIHSCGFYCGLYPEMTDYDLQIIISCLIK